MSIYPIVGERHYPPAKAILLILPIGTELDLIPEPGNHYDPNAIQVWINGAKIPQRVHNILQNLLQPYGFNMDEVRSEVWQLGHIKRDATAKLQPGFRPRFGRFCIGADGRPKVEL